MPDPSCCNANWASALAASAIVMYAHGLDVVEGDAQAIRWFRKAAEQGDANARAALKRLGGAPG